MGGTRSSSTSRVANPPSTSDIALDDIRSGRLQVKDPQVGQWLPEAFWERGTVDVVDNVLFSRDDGRSAEIALIDRSGEILARASLVENNAPDREASGTTHHLTGLSVPENLRRRGYATRLYRAVLKKIAPGALRPEAASGMHTSPEARAVQRSLERFPDIEVRYSERFGNVDFMRYVD